MVDELQLKHTTLKFLRYLGDGVLDLITVCIHTVYEFIITL